MPDPVFNHGAGLGLRSLPAGPGRHPVLCIDSSLSLPPHSPLLWPNTDTSLTVHTLRWGGTHRSALACMHILMDRDSRLKNILYIL
jgi:hypothetical protein